MSKFGIIFCGYNHEETVEQALEPFMNDERFVIAAISVPFEEYKNQEPYEDKTTEILRKLGYSANTINKKTRNDLATMLRKYNFPYVKEDKKFRLVSIRKEVKLNDSEIQKEAY